jgi:hypothetical protein
MRLFDFHCDQYGREFEELVREVLDARWPACSSADVANELSAFAVEGSRGEPVAASGRGVFRRWRLSGHERRRTAWARDQQLAALRGDSTPSSPRATGGTSPDAVGAS